MLQGSCEPHRRRSTALHLPGRHFDMTVRAIVFDAYGTLYDVQSVRGLATRLCGDKGELITQIWRLKQLEYVAAGIDAQLRGFLGDDTGGARIRAGKRRDGPDPGALRSADGQV